MNGRRPFGWCGLLLLLQCDPPPFPCRPPAYEDLSHWFSTSAELVATCGAATRAVLDTPAGVSQVVAHDYIGYPGDVLWVNANMLRTEGSGKLSALIWAKYTYGMSGPDAHGRTTVWGAVPDGRATITFLGQAGAEPLRWEVSDVTVSTIEVVR